MAGRWRCWALLLGLAGCPQFQNDDWVVATDASALQETGDGANGSDSTADLEAGRNASDAAADDAAADAASSHDGAADAHDATADAASSDDAAVSSGDSLAPDGDAGPGLESGPPDSSASDGAVAAQMLYCGLTNPRGIDVFNGDVYWVGDLTPRGLFRASAAGGGTVAHIDVPGDGALLVDAFDVLLDATYVYWSNGKNNQVVQRPQSGGPAQQYFAGGGSVSFLARGDGATLWATDFPDPSDPGTSFGEVIVGPSGGGTSSNAIYNAQPGAAGVAVYNGNVYWGTPSGLAFGSVVGNGMIYSIQSPETPVAGVAVDAMGVAYFLAGNDSLYRYVTGTQSPVLMYQETRAFGAGDVAVDDTYLYFSEPDLGCIVRVAK